MRTQDHHSQLFTRNTGSSIAAIICSKIGEPPLERGGLYFIVRCWTWPFNHMLPLENHLLEKMEGNKTLLQAFWRKFELLRSFFILAIPRMNYIDDDNSVFMQKFPVCTSATVCYKVAEICTSLSPAQGKQDQPRIMTKSLLCFLQI